MTQSHTIRVMNEDFAYVIEKLGPLQQATKIAPAATRKWMGRLPSGLLELWVEYGVGSWDRCKFQLCDPDDYAGVVDMMLQGDAEFSPEQTHLVGFGAFGDLVLWHETRENLEISLPYLRGSAACYRDGWKPSDANVAITNPLLHVREKEAYTLFSGEKATPMFSQCARQHGRLAMGECYGLFPALALGGTSDPKNVKRVKAREHFALLAQLGPIQLVDYRSSGGMRVIRQLGAG